MVAPYRNEWILIFESLLFFKPIIPDQIFPLIHELENKDKRYTLNDYSWSTYNISEQTENNIDS